MSQLNSTNYPAATPVAADYIPFVRDSDSAVRTVDLQVLANVIQSLAGTNLSVDVISANAGLTTEQLVIANSAGAFDLDLPASSLNTGRRFLIFNKGAGAVTVVPDGIDTIAGAASLVLAQYEGVTLVSDGLGMWAQFGP